MITEASRIHGISEYYFSRKLAQIKAMDQDGGETIINLGIGSPDLPPDPSVIEALISATSTPGANKYQPYTGLPDIRKAFANWYQRHFDVTLDPDKQILPLTGSKEAVMHLSMALLNPGDGVLIPDPGYPAYAACAKIAGANIISFDLTATNNYLPDLEALSALDTSRIKMMWLNYPNMPTGALADKGFFKELRSWAAHHEILVVHDNPYTFILNDYPCSILQVDEPFPYFAELTSLSKNYHMAGWRIGALAADHSIIQAALKFKSNMDSGIYMPLQKAAIQALSLDQSWFDAINEHYTNRRHLAHKIMNNLLCQVEASAAGMFLWAKVPHGTNGETLSERILKEARVFITPGFIFGKNGNEYLRISLCADEDMLKEALLRISNTLML